jgi:hypothetical protein
MEAPGLTEVLTNDGDGVFQTNLGAEVLRHRQEDFFRTASIAGGIRRPKFSEPDRLGKGFDLVRCQMGVRGERSGARGRLSGVFLMERHLGGTVVLSTLRSCLRGNTVASKPAITVTRN